MKAREINRDNIAVAIDETLEECLQQLRDARGERVLEDLRIAVESLRGIRGELRGDIPQRPKGMRSGLFSRYALDANDQLAMDAALKKKVVRIEGIYKRL